MVETTAAEQNKGKRMKRIADSLTDLWDNIKHTTIWVLGVPEEEKKKKDTEKMFEEIILENFPNMGNEIVNQDQEVQRIPYRINPRRNTLRHMLIKLTEIKHKEWILKAASNRGGKLHTINSWNLSAETLQVSGEWQDINLKYWKGKNLQPRLLYLARISFKTDEEIKSFTDK